LFRKTVSRRSWTKNPLMPMRGRFVGGALPNKLIRRTATSVSTKLRYVKGFSRVGGLVCALPFVFAACSQGEAESAETPRTHVNGLPEWIGKHARDPNPKLRLAEERKIGDSHGFVLPGLCDESEATLAVAERGNGIERHEVGWYSVGATSYSVVRWDWTDEATFDSFATAMLQDSVCLSGPWDQELQISGAPARLWQSDNPITPRPIDATELKLILDETILSVTCGHGSLSACRDFAATLLTALDAR
jgi:hypothetical protein